VASTNYGLEDEMVVDADNSEEDGFVPGNASDEGVDEEDDDDIVPSGARSRRRAGKESTPSRPAKKKAKFTIEPVSMTLSGRLDSKPGIFLGLCTNYQQLPHSFCQIS
jgi:hypothetical protein